MLQECLYRVLYGADEEDRVGQGHTGDNIREKLRLKLELARKKKIQDKKALQAKAGGKMSNKVDERGLDEVRRFSFFRIPVNVQATSSSFLSSIRDLALVTFCAHLDFG